MTDPIPLSTILTVIFYILLLVYVIFTTVLYYHWNNYSADKTANTITYGLYFAVTIPLILILGAVILFIS